MHGLRAALGEIKNGEPAMAERNARFIIDKDRSGVGAAMANRKRHGLNWRL
jgi:hypothetical protein